MSAQNPRTKLARFWDPDSALTPGLFNTPPNAFLVRIGSWSARARIEAQADAALLDEIFKGALQTPSDAVPVDAILHWSASTQETPLPAIPLDGLVVTGANTGTWLIASQALTMRVESGAPIPIISVMTHPHTLDHLARRVHVSVIFHKLLFLLGRLYLHGGAVRVHDSASAFIAEKWSGKSSICMWLGRAGATILADDHIVIHKTDNSFQVSGCETVARVTAVTEAALFSTPLAIEARDFAGMLKKEFRVADVFTAMPYYDVPLRRIFFPHVGARWHLQSMTGRATLARLLAATRPSHRFTSGDDYARHLEYFSDLVRSVEAFDLELSPDLNELDRLVEFLDV